MQRNATHSTSRTATRGLCLSPAFAGGLFLLLFLGPFGLQSFFALGVGRRIRDDLEEGIHPGLRFAVGGVRLFEFLDLDLDAFGIEARFLHQELGELVLLRFLPLEFDVRVHLVVVKEVSGQDIGRGGGGSFFCSFVVVFSLLVRGFVFVFFVRDPRFWNRVFCDILYDGQNLFDAAVFADEFESSLGPNSFDVVAVITSQKDTQIYELIVRQSQPLDRLAVVHGLDLRPLGGLVSKRQFSDQNRGRKRQGVHVLRPGCVNQSGLAEGRGLGLRLHGRQYYGDPHEPQQALAVFVFFAPGSCKPLRVLVHFLLVVFVGGFFEFFLRLAAFLPSFFQFSRFHVGGLSVKDKDGLQSLGQKATGSVEHPLDVTRGLSIGVCEHRGLLVRSTAADGNQKLVDGHGCIDGDLASVKRFEFDLPNAIGSLVGKQFGEAFDSHSSIQYNLFTRS
mmetsp:Transcript_17563/g.36379  ORF Transcript_17563/g.36379 Transcript_17563/m.36379 type:complete len:448 (-) Transcript_17563:393-1736(-)